MTDPNVDRERTPGRSGDADWPVSLSGVTETVVTTLGPNGRWNAAALGLVAGGDADTTAEAGAETGATVTATTWGRTRTRGNFHREGGGYVQFVRDPVTFVDAALSIFETDDPILDAAAAWVRVEATPIETGTDEGTRWERWSLEPVESRVLTECVPTIDRGFGAVVEASVLASRLGVQGYDDEALLDRLAYTASVVDRAGGSREVAAFDRISSHADLSGEIARFGPE